jgi:hypothetical protein
MAPAYTYGRKPHHAYGYHIVHLPSALRPSRFLRLFISHYDVIISQWAITLALLVLVLLDTWFSSRPGYVLADVCNKQSYKRHP